MNLIIVEFFRFLFFWLVIVVEKVIFIERLEWFIFFVKLCREVLSYRLVGMGMEGDDGNFVCVI